MNYRAAKYVTASRSIAGRCVSLLLIKWLRCETAPVVLFLSSFVEEVQTSFPWHRRSIYLKYTSNNIRYNWRISILDTHDVMTIPPQRLQ